MEHILDELKRYVAFTADDEAALAGLRARVVPHVPAIADEFYARILGHEGARQSITGGLAQVERLKGTLRTWTERLFIPPYDQAYYEQRARIGRVHVAIGLPQQYMFTAMDVIRLQLTEIVLETAPDRAQRSRELAAVNKILDLELAIMLHTYKEDYLKQAHRNERLATFGQLVASIGHELRNPLGVMESSLYLVRSRVPPEEKVTKHLDRIGEQIKVSNRIITDLLDMVRDRPAERQLTRLDKALETAVEHVPSVRATSLQVDLAPDATLLLVDPEHVRQILTNLLQNAAEAAAGGTVHVSARSDGTTVVVRVEDSGPGIDGTIAARLFEPLVTTKARGVGLGLALCRKLAERNGGTVVRAAPSVLTGACFEVRLPTGAAVDGQHPHRG
ncbi:MAG: ATP-binding protein [Deltaproteobacteria bacterium]|nr:ATP-binding protein [Deltaproteobacteria bacterium]